MLKRFLRDNEGATAIEYALIASLVSISIIGVLLAINQQMIDMFGYIGDNLGLALRGNE